jgi:hypothetical protein
MTRRHTRTGAAAAALAALAGGGIATAAIYPLPPGPITTGPRGAPGGFTSVVRGVFLPNSGGTLSTSIGSTKFRVTVPPQSFLVDQIDVVVTRANTTALSRALPGLGLRHVRLLASAGVAFLAADASRLPSGSFLGPSTIEFQANNLRGKVKAYEFTSARRVHTVRFQRRSGGRIDVQLSDDVALFLVS